MAYPANPQMWHYYFRKENFQDAIDFYNACNETWDSDCPLEYKPVIGATPSHIFVGCETDAFTFGDCGENKESELWYSKCDFIETHECTRIQNPNKKW